MLGPGVATKLKKYRPCPQFQVEAEKKEICKKPNELLNQRLGMLVLEGAPVWCLEN